MDREVLVRHSTNPILTAADWPYDINAAFNPAAIIQKDGRTTLLCRVESKTGVSHIGCIHSENGINNWQFGSKILPQGEEEEFGLEDPRVIYADEIGKYIITCTSVSSDGPGVSVFLSENLCEFNSIGRVLYPENKDAVVFPRRFQGMWIMLHRPVMGDAGHIWISKSPDLKYWGDHEVFCRSESGTHWDSSKIGASTPPILTDEGWLMMYHSGKSTPSGHIYRCGLLLMDKENPCKILKRSRKWIFAPRNIEERVGDVGNVVFPCGWTIKEKEVRIYYGAADSSICLATATVDQLLNSLDN